MIKATFRRKTEFDSGEVLGKLIIVILSLLAGAALIGLCYGSGTESRKNSGLYITSAQSEQMIQLDFPSTGKQEVSQIRYWGEEIQLTGKIDYARAYFSGVLEGDPGSIVLFHPDSEKQLQLTPSLRAALLGDYYVSCTYLGETQQTQLLIFYCPE